MEEATNASSKIGLGMSRTSLKVITSVIAGLSAVASAVLPGMLAKTESSAPAAKADVVSADSTLPNLTYGVWTLTESMDDEGTDFSNSTLKFTSQTPTADGLQLTGFFEWHTGETVAGREFVAANYLSSTRQLFIEGQTVQSPTGQLAVGSFSAQLSPDGRRLSQGTWGSTPGNLRGVPGSWEARR